MTPGYLRAPGVWVAPLGEDGFAAYSALSGESHVVNHESVAVLEALDPLMPMSAASVCQRLAHEHGLAADELEDALAMAWESLISAGLVRLAPTGTGSSAPAGGC